MDTINSGLTKIGTISSYFGLGTAIIMGIVFLVIGYFLYKKNESNLVTTNATILDVGACTGTGTKTRKCKLLVEYNVNGTLYRNEIYSNKFMPLIGNTIEVSYDKTRPSDVTEKQMKSKYVAFIFSCIAIVLIGGAIANVYFVKKSPTYAAYQGVKAIF